MSCTCEVDECGQVNAAWRQVLTSCLMKNVSY